MSWLVVWEDKEIDIDPLAFSMADWEQIEQRAGVSGLLDILQPLGRFNPACWKALYWIGARRAGMDPPPFGDFDGPTYRDVLAQKSQIEAFSTAIDELIDGPKAPATPGSQPSEPSTDGALPNASPA